MRIVFTFACICTSLVFFVLEELPQKKEGLTKFINSTKQLAN
jgi:hypothetical protein